VTISWVPPAPRPGRQGWWDRFIGPGATPAEGWLQLIGALALAALLLGYSLWRAAGPWSPLQAGALALLALDLSGGVITNATSAAKRWYHRPGQGPRQHLAFVLPHGAHLALLAWLFPALGWPFALLCYLYLAAASVAVLLTPLYLQRPLALIAYVGALLLNLVLAPPPALAWVAPLFFLKLLVAHLLKEAPFQPGPAPVSEARGAAAAER
jgi:hypothetical protein